MKQHAVTVFHRPPERLNCAQAVFDASGPIFDAMKQWNPAKHPGVAAAALKVDQIYCGGEQLV